MITFNDNNMINRKIDLYGQAVTMLISLWPYLFFIWDGHLSGRQDWVIASLYHGLVLLVLGCWQLISSIVNALLMKEKNKNFFIQNALLGMVLGLAFLVFLWDGLDRAGLRPAQQWGDWLVVAYFLLIDVLSVRYWIHLRKTYKTLSNVKENSGIGRF
jgi:hypothetical protein